MNYFTVRFVAGALKFVRWYLVCPFGGRVLKKMLTQGLPPTFREPFEFLLGRPLSAEDRSVRDKIEAIRAELLKRGTESIAAYAALSAPGAGQKPEGTPGFKTPVASLNYIASVSSILPYWGTFLFLAARAEGAKTILELGSCAGISGCYLASAPSCTNFVTIEGAPQLAKVAESHLAMVSHHYRVVNSSFNDGLDQILPTLESPLDLVFIDGEHTKPARLHYFQRLLPYLREGSVLLFDDIHWSHEVYEAWGLLSRWPGMTCSVNLGRLGLCIWGGGSREPAALDFSAFTAFWRKGKPAPLNTTR